MPLSSLTTDKTASETAAAISDLQTYVKTTIEPNIPVYSISEPDATDQGKPWIKLNSDGSIDAIYIYDVAQQGWFTRMPSPIGTTSVVLSSGSLGIGWEDTDLPGSLNAGWKYQTFSGTGLSVSGTFAYKRHTQSYQ